MGKVVVDERDEVDVELVEVVVAGVVEEVVDEVDVVVVLGAQVQMVDVLMLQLLRFEKFVLSKKSFLFL